ncbi:MAG: DUF4369 domain-containing protein, partial [Chlorobi bacterium]|nr:DUF4369 domain-containing protein [Chlorobiota bacterium]
MKKIFYILFLLVTVISCTHSSESFEFKIKGKLTGKNYEKLYFLKSLRNGDEVIIPVEDGIFEYSGHSSQMYFSLIGFDDSGDYFPFVIEPGEIDIELYADSILRKSRIIRGKNSIALEKAIKQYIEYMDSGLEDKVLRDSIVQLINRNKDNYTGIILLNMMGREY